LREFRTLAGLVRDLKKNIFLPWLSLAVLFGPVKENISLLAKSAPLPLATQVAKLVSMPAALYFVYGC
jgi:hypothetical protein